MPSPSASVWSLSSALIALAANSSLVAQQPRFDGSANSLYVTYPRFQQPSSYDSAGPNLLVGDIDGDGDLDVTWLFLVMDLNIFVNDGSGQFSRTRYFMDTSKYGNGLTTAHAHSDVDRDGDLDIIVVRDCLEPKAQCLLFLNNGKGTFSTSESAQRLPNTSIIGNSIVAGDLDGDGDDDLIIGCGASRMWERNRIYFNDGRGYFTESLTHLPPNQFRTAHMALADLDGDGDLDLVKANGDLWWLDPNEVYLNDGKGSFIDGGFDPRVDATTCVAVGDVDGDGDLDLLFGNVSGQDRLYLNDGKAKFTDATNRIPVTPSVLEKRAYLFDVDGDSDLDVISFFPNTDYWWINDGRGHFQRTASPRMLPWVSPRETTFGDFDNDGDEDVIAIGFPSSSDLKHFKLYVNLDAQLYTPPDVALGGTFRLDMFGRPGEFFFPAISFGFTPIDVPGYGRLVLDPRSLLSLTPMRISASRSEALTLQVPTDPGLRGLKFYSQALRIDPQQPQRSRLSNWLATTLR